MTQITFDAHPATPRDFAANAEYETPLPHGPGERFAGYGVMGLTFASGHVLTLRRWVASSLGVPFTSVWHRTPNGRWTYYADVEPTSACPRYTGAEVDEAAIAQITLSWATPHDLLIDVPDAAIRWRVSLQSTPVTNALNVARAVLPSALLRQPIALRALGKVASWSLGAGRVRLEGTMPNGQQFGAAPSRLWMVRSSFATIDGISVGAPAALSAQIHIGDFWIPQRGLFAVGEARFAEFDPSRHLAVMQRVAR